MKCECGGKMLTRDTRQIDAGIWRKRSCDTCPIEITTLEQVCKTVKAPYAEKRDRVSAQGVVVAPTIPNVQQPSTRPTKTAVNVRRAPKPADPNRLVVLEQRGPVDQVTQTARDRVEEMKADREAAREYGWDR